MQLDLGEARKRRGKEPSEPAAGPSSLLVQRAREFQPRGATSGLHFRTLHEKGWREPGGRARPSETRVCGSACDGAGGLYGCGAILVRAAQRTTPGPPGGRMLKVGPQGRKRGAGGEAGPAGLHGAGGREQRAPRWPGLGIRRHHITPAKLSRH